MLLKCADQAWIDTVGVSSFFRNPMIHGPAAISIGNETDVTRDIIFRHSKAYSDILSGHTMQKSSLLSRR